MATSTVKEKVYVKEGGYRTKYGEKGRGMTIWDRLNSMRYTAPLSLARAQLLTDGYREYEGYQLFHKRGLVIRKILNEIPINIDNDQLLVGDFSAKPMSHEWYPDLAALWIRDYVDNYGWEGKPGLFSFGSPEEAQQARDIAVYWENIGGKETYEKFIGPEDVEFETEIGETQGWITNTLSEMFAEKAWNVPDISRMVARGVKGLIADIDEQLENLLITTYEEYLQHEFLVGLRYMLLGGIEYAHRYAALAREMAEKETDTLRKEELLTIAATCDRVPEFPAETFQEALQSTYFGILMMFYDTRTYGMGYGRVDQYMYPQYKADIEAGKIDQEYATQLLECFRVKVMEKRQFWPDTMTPSLQGESHFHNCVIGGVDPVTARDATNELSFLWLEAAARVRTPHPTISVRWHSMIDKKFMDRALEVVSMGMGFPAFFNDEPTVEYLLSRGYTIEEARSYAIGGCVLHQVPGKQSSVWPLVQNFGKMLELTLYNGYNPFMGKTQSIETGEFKNFKSFDEFFDAYTETCRYWAVVATKASRACRVQHGDSFPDVMMSAFVDDCIKRGKVCSLGGAAHHDNSQYIVPVGVQDVGNALYVLKNAIFVDDPICDKETLIKALLANWKGYEDLRAQLQDLPKYGNDNPEVDDLVDKTYAMIREVWYEMPAAHGWHFEVAPHSIGFHAGSGAKCGALPCGREAHVAMADGAVSPTQGSDVLGPTAVINSAGRVDQTELFGVLFNMRFSPSALKTDAGRANLSALIHTYFADYKGKHIQFNVMSREDMIAAKKEPEKHRDLIVRVAGYSAYWTDLTEVTQDELIRRSENEW
jgi:formate C-acetyltransferase